MTNTYGYNRKTQEEDQKILLAVLNHHITVKGKGHHVVFTSLVGSQNYDLDDEQSDIDTFTFILPSIKDLAQAKEPYSGMFEVEDGHCEVKDIRLALNLLKKASPNSIEYFTSKYKAYNPKYKSILQQYLEDNTKMWNMIHCNYNHMLYSIAGMAHQLVKRNLPAGKRFSHALRLDDMYYHFMNSPNANAILDLRAGGDWDLAMMAKRNTDPKNDIEYNNQCGQIAVWLDECRNNFQLTKEQEQTQKLGNQIIDTFQMDLFKQYLKEICK